MNKKTRVPSWVTDPHPSLADRQFGQRAAKAVLRALRASIPGDRLKTWTYLNCIMAPRKLLRRAATGFSRFDFVYDVLKEFTSEFRGPFSIIELGTAQGYAFAKLLGATRYHRVEDLVTVHGFDSFEGLPEAVDAGDRGIVGNPWIKGAYRASYDTLRDYCDRRGFKNYRLHKGYFEDSLSDEVVAIFQHAQPILVWVDCDLYSSSLTAFERLLPTLRSGCVIYFDDVDFNFRSRFTGQARLIREVNDGRFGPDMELVVDANLSWDSHRVFRFIRVGPDAQSFERLYQRTTPPQARPIVDGSPFP